ncbi:hypothetical protein A2V49_02520 [candidate division WWE3 bacterium RBG_19FT_COMBO_34_6]|uniref:Aldehyde ferredoxin oxidoreductase N-terminal domain-containing protein n=1 Tax=candidate division WWE3 bacterium RBG_19FT_COMBO_34_6 TaxID=1802612 RepID=A0A1F4UNY1_UNCKA|nr:MAG: hypothetical protein A2V49_02520 [candidate division WWE3 bacterium RBG_19FT_COMBO_34_6]
MDLSNKKVLFINLQNKSFELKTYADLNKFIGGVGLGIKLMDMYKNLDPLIFCVGPLNGFFPFVSKAAVLFMNDNKLEDVYLGGYMSTRIKFCDLDAIIFHGKSDDGVVLDILNEEVHFKNSDENPNNLGLPGKKSSLVLKDKKIILDEYFEEDGSLLANKLKSLKIFGITITGTKVFIPKNMAKYTEVYKTILEKTSQIAVEKGFFPSCSGCPMGCEKSITGENGGNILVHSLVACQSAEKIYSDVGTVFSCLNVLGYDYTHEDVENFNYLVSEVLKNLS